MEVKNVEHSVSSLVKRVIEDIDEALAELASKREMLMSALAKTEEVLAIAQSLDVDVVAIGKIHELVANEHWNFGYQGSIFTHPDARVDGWPAAWAISERARIGSGAGNTGQHQIMSGSVIDGVYRCVDGLWERVE